MCVVRTPCPTDQPTPNPPSVHHRMLLTWLAVYAAITVVQLALGTSTAYLPTPVRTLILTACVVPAVVYLLVPTLLRLHAAVARQLHRRLNQRARRLRKNSGTPSARGPLAERSTGHHELIGAASDRRAVPDSRDSQKARPR
jgi:hypothetical protein